MKSSNWQIRSDPGPSAAPSELLLLLLACCCYDSPCLHALITPNVRCTGHEKVPTPAAQAKAWPDSLSPDPSHFTLIVCLTGSGRPCPKLSTLWPSLSSSHLPVCRQNYKNNRQRKSPLCSHNPQDGVGALLSLSNPHTQKCLPLMPGCVEINFGVKSCTTRRPITTSFTRQITQRKTDSVAEEIRWKKEKETAVAVSGCDRVWPFAILRGNLAVAATDGPVLRKTHTHTKSARLSGSHCTVIFLTEKDFLSKVGMGMVWEITQCTSARLWAKLQYSKLTEHEYSERLKKLILFTVLSAN